jgi:hypothetical protein
MKRSNTWTAGMIAIFVVGMILSLADGPRPLSSTRVVFAADAVKIDGLSNDPRQFRIQVDQIIAKTDALIQRLKGNSSAQAIVLDLMQTRDNVLREISKIEASPGDAKWTVKEMRDSVQAMLKLLKDQYEKAEAAGG